MSTIGNSSGLNIMIKINTENRCFAENVEFTEIF